MADVVIVGAGPVGMLLAGDLARRGLEVEVLERRPTAGHGSRAIGIHAPVLAHLEESGVTDELLATAVRVRRGEARAGGERLGTVHFDRLSTRFPFVATLPQETTERVLAARAPQAVRGATVWSVTPGEDGVRIRAGIAGRPVEFSAALVVVAAGGSGRDLVYRPRAAEATERADRYLMTDTDAPVDAQADTAVVHLDGAGVLESFPLPGGQRRYVAWDAAATAPGRPDDASARRLRLNAAIAARVPGAPEVADAAAFGVRRFVAPRLRNGRLVVIGDAAHEVSPIGGQGLNLGLLDAVTLAPLLARWVRERSAPDLELLRWERRRVASARRAARLADLNTALGRSLPPTMDRARRVGVRTMLSPVSRGLFARAYAMGFDLDADSSRPT